MRTKYYNYLSLLAVLFCACETKETVIPSQEESKLIIHWDGSWGERSTAKLYLYDSEEEFKKPGGKAYLNLNLGSFAPLGSLERFLPLASPFLNNLPPKKFWIRIFNAGYGFIDHNQDSTYVYQYSGENTTTTIVVPTKRLTMNSYSIKKIDIYDLPAGIVNGEQVELGFWTNDAAQPLETLSLTVNNGMVSYQPASNKFLYNYQYILLKHAGSDTPAYYKINVIDLMNLNAYFGNEYSIKSDRKEIALKVYLEWDVEEYI